MTLPGAPFVLERLDVRALSVATFDPFVIATGEVHATRSIAVTARVRLGGAAIEGMGEGACLPPVTREDQPDALAAAERAAKALAGRTVANLEAFAELLDEVLPEAPVARSGIEVAVLDALARHAGVPLFAWLAPDRAPNEAATLETDITLPILEQGRMVVLAREWIGRGFRSLKVKIGKDLDHDLRVLAAVHAAVPKATFRPDANTGLTVAEAIHFAREAGRIGAVLECFEQPCRTLDELGEVARAIDPPVLADESVKTLADLDAVLAARAADGVNLKITKSGSLLRAHAIGRRAKQHGLSVMVGGMVETRLGMTTAAHLAAAVRAEFCDLDTAWLLREDPFDGGYRADGPDYRLPWSPGLDVTIRRGPSSKLE